MIFFFGSKIKREIIIVVTMIINYGVEDKGVTHSI